MRKYFILLFLGIVLTVLFMVFSAVVMESIYYEREFSNEMYNQSLYGMVAVIDVVIAAAMTGLFYYVINSVSFSRWYHWLIILGVGAIASSITAYNYCDGIFANDGVDYSDQLFGFSMTNLLVEVLLFVIASYSMRWWSSNCRHTPIPE